jgi:Pyruvate/2-oxoacid:ferredoxin oxidoreductase delta subunit
MNERVYKDLALKLDALPQGFPATEDGVELRLLATFFSPEEADIASQLKLPLETTAQIAARTGRDKHDLRKILKSMARRTLIRIGKVDGELGFGLMPFVVGIYEGLLGEISYEQAHLFEQYYMSAFGKMIALEPAVHRVIPVQETVRVDMEISPYESVTDIINNAQAWGVMDCICRRQKAEIGEACGHPLDVCLAVNKRPHVFDNHETIRALTREEALQTLQRAADAGLVHSVSNNQRGLHYICNCCTCSCGILRGMADLGLANVVARSAFVNTVDQERCIGCEECLADCQFDALSLNDDFVVEIQAHRCVGCGVCVSSCTEGALSLVRRPEEEVKEPPPTVFDWGMERALAREIDITRIM